MSRKIAPGASAERTVSFSLMLDAVRTQMSAVTKGQLVRHLWRGTKSYWCSKPVEALVDSRCGKTRTMVHVPGHGHMDTAQWFCTARRSNDCGIIMGLGAAIGGQCHVTYSKLGS